MLEQFEQGFQHWKLVTDVLLLLSLGYLGLRFSRSPGVTAHSRQLADLEVALKGLIKEADAAGRSLNDQLLKRQSALEKLLIDVDVSEHRMTRSVSGAEDTLVQIRREQARFEQLVAEGRAGMPQPAAKISAAPATPVREPSPEPNKISAAASYAPIAPEPVPQLLAQTEAVEDVLTLEVPETPQRAAKSERKYNIYGEEIEQPTPQPKALPKSVRAQQSYRPLQQQIERTVEASSTAISSNAERAREPEHERPVAKKAASESELLRSAEQYLRAGKSIESVSQALKLPTQTVQLLARVLQNGSQIAANAKRQRIEVQEQTGPEVSEVDPRLGVFAEIRRETQLL